MGRRRLDALIFRVVEGSLDGAPEFRVIDSALINFFRGRGWFLLAREDDIRMADIDETRRDDQGRFGGDR